MVNTTVLLRYLFTKNQYKSVSTHESKGSYLEKLPDEILIHIFSQSALDFDTLGSVMELSPRMKYLGIHVLRHYRLGCLQMSLQIDQEGKNRISSKFQVERFDPATFSVSMTCINKTPRRYYSNRASPLIRSMNIADSYNSLLLLPDSNTIITDDDYSSFKSKESATQITKTEGDTSNGGKVNRKIETKKEGLHILQVIHNTSQGNKSVKWKFVYQISEKQGKEYRFLPVSIIIELDQLLLLLNKKQKTMNYL
ncbi:hypothetical protein MFLAVUS_009111 [Mucor flavus]|uniref:F-box domain-containing protein n=1 Tax=Mucor flavus TaxID=439312 RepID=A0ABP9Z912_9FUNG